MLKIIVVSLEVGDRFAPAGFGDAYNREKYRNYPSVSYSKLMVIFFKRHPRWVWAFKYSEQTGELFGPASRHNDATSACNF